MKPFRDEELINHPALRYELEAQRATEPLHTRTRGWPIGWLIIVVMGVVLIVLISLPRLTG